MHRLFFTLSFLFGWILVLGGCTNNPNSSQKNDKPIEITEPNSSEIMPEKECLNILSDTTLTIAGHLVDIRIPAGVVKADLLVLPGWNFSRNDWCNKSTLCKQALELGFRLILPEMGKSIYASQSYPETRKKWLKYPDGKWVTEQLIPFLDSSHCILDTSTPNFILGLSTGARGAVMTTLRMPDRFAACAALSGDYDQTQLPKDNLMKGWYGKMDDFPQRWSGADNPFNQIKDYQTPLYIGHGMKDKVVPPEQSLRFFEALKAEQPQLRIAGHFPQNAKHDYDYWGSETGPLLEFFGASNINVNRK